MRGDRNQRLLLLSMYPLGGDVYGPITRITHLRDALAQLIGLDVIAGPRLRRATEMVRYVAGGRLRGLAGIYVESSTTLPGPGDVVFLALARAYRIPVLTYLRDAYPLFPEYTLTGGPKRWLSNRLFRFAFSVLIAISGSVAFPSRGLAAAFGQHRRPLLLPPGSPPPVDVPRRPDADQILHVGALSHPELGADILLAAIEQLRAEGHPVKLTLVARPGEEPAGQRSTPEWMRVVRGSGGAIHRLLPRVFATVIPRHRGAYHDLAVPTKLMEYLSYGRPLLVTDCTEQAAIVRSAKAGLVVPDSADGLADGIRSLFGADSALLDRYSAAARAAAREHSWERRAHDVLKLLRMER
jgi:glycosyltransferase involved in cell wall biosynthesis